MSFSGIAICLIAAAPGMSWDFSEGSAGDWVANAYLEQVRVEEGVLHATAVGWDPFFLNQHLDLEATPWQCVEVRIRATAPGRGELFWSGSLEGENGGLSQTRSTSFRVRGGDAWQTVRILPFWHREGRIRQVRLDLYDGAAFEINWIRVLPWTDAPVLEDAAALDVTSWLEANEDERWAPPLSIPTEIHAWAAIALNAESHGTGALLFATDTAAGMQAADFTVRPGAQTVNVELQGMPQWRGALLALGLRLPAGIQVQELELREQPGGPAAPVIKYLGPEDALPRAGRDFTLLALIQNLGGSDAILEGISLDAPGLDILESPAWSAPIRLGYEARQEFRWRVTTGTPIPEARVRLQVDTQAGPLQEETPFAVSVAPAIPQAEYVPRPRPVETSVDVAAYYFPGWNQPALWDPIRRTAPERKPLLGYYDEAKPEVVDWQIKWARENGIACFLVDWYWVAGQQHLTHWFEAYREARYRDDLAVALMWANHNPPNTHSREDWRAVTQHWIEHYFTLPAYYNIDGKPAIFLWDPNGLRRDLGGSDEVRAALEDSQQMARDAGHAGIYFAALFGHEAEAGARTLAEEGYHAMTNYHEWGRAETEAVDPKRLQFERVVETVEAVWAEKDARSGALEYFPVADTGWASQPWHGSRSMVIAGRTPTLFRALLEQQRRFAKRTGKRLVVLGPVNEWGEGSYIEPCVEFGFEMLEAVREVYATTPREQWPLNYGPRDVGLEPYDFPDLPPTRAWHFETDTQGWAAMMGLEDFRAEDGALRFTTSTDDPAMVVSLRDVEASGVEAITLHLAAEAPSAEAVHGQLFWTVSRGPASEASSLRFSVPADGSVHEVRLEVGKHPRWRGEITSLRLDPTNLRGVQVRILQVGLLP